MTFNKGYMCKRCGPVAEAKKRTIAKVSYDCCKVCDGIVTAWERPLNERPGRCLNCAGATFTSRVGQGEHRGNIILTCKVCEQERVAETGEVIIKGNEGKRWRGNTNIK